MLKIFKHTRKAALLILLYCSLAFGQNIKYLKEVEVSFEPHISLSTAQFEKQFKNRVYQPQMLDEIRDSFQKFMKGNGYYFSRVDSIETVTKQKNQITVIINSDPGNPLFLQKITIINRDSLSARQLNQITEISQSYAGKVYTSALTNSLFEGIVEYFENHGYPLARIQTQDFRFLNSENGRMLLELQLKVVKGDSVQIDYLRFPGGTDKDNTYLARLLHFNPGTPYQQERINRYPQILRRQDFIKSVHNPVLMIDNKDNYFLDVRYEEAPATTLDGIVGYIPPPINSEQNGYFTGLVNIGIRNLFGTGRKLLIFWQKQDQYSDEFRLAYREPFVLGLPFHTDVGLYRLVRDTTYIEWKYDAKFELPINESLSAYVKLTSRQVVPDSLASRQLRLPETKSLITESGIGWDVRDDIQNPRRGAHLQVSFSFGRQQNVGPPYLLAEDSLAERATIQRASVDFELFIPTFKRQVLANHIHGEGVTASENVLRLPDMIWFGGATSLRGFREAQFYGERVAWVNSEYRFLLGPQSRFFFFVDNGYFFRDIPDFQEKWLTGYGLGMRFTSPLGALQVDFGMEKGKPFREGKIHFRLINEF